MTRRRKPTAFMHEASRVSGVPMRHLPPESPVARERMASMMGLNPHDRTKWPIDIIDRLIEIERTRSPIDFQAEFRRLLLRQP